MNFNIDVDAGSHIAGWLVPDNPSAVPSFFVTVEDQAPISFSANIERVDVRELGLHRTGHVGFLIDDRLVPNIGDVENLAISEAETGLPLYRRHRNDRYLRTKLILVDVGLMPQFNLTRRIGGRFALSYPMVDRQPLETVNAVIANHSQQSIFIGGQPNWQRSGESAVTRGFVSAALLRDPFEELAERLIFLSYLSRRSSDGISSAFARHAVLSKFASRLDLEDDRALLSGFRKVTPEERRALRSPMTSIFGCTPDEEPQRRHVSMALDQLARFNVVGTRSRFPEFADLLGGCLGADLVGPHTPEALPQTVELAERLKRIGVVEDLLDEDIALYSFADEAIGAALASTVEVGHA